MEGPVAGRSVTGTGRVLPARWWRVRGVELHTSGIWDVGHVRFETGSVRPVGRCSSGEAGSAYGHDEAFNGGPGWWGGRPDRGGDGSCFVGVECERVVVPTSIFVEDAPGRHRAIRVAVDSSDDGSVWNEVSVVSLDTASRRHLVFYAPAEAQASRAWRLGSKSPDPAVLRSFERARFLRCGVDLDASVTAVADDGSLVTVTTESDRELDRIVIGLPDGVTAESVVLERLTAAGSWSPWRHLGTLRPGHNDLLLHGDPELGPSREVQRRRPAEPLDRRILVLIAAYRDPELADTVFSAITQAAYPEHLRFAICHQYDDDTRELLAPWVDDGRFRIDAVPHAESRGCCWARHRTFELHDGEPYVFQIDAHTRFAARWDARYVAMLESIGSPRVVLTTYPPRYTVDDDGSIRHDLAAGVQRLYIDEVRDDLTTLQKTSPVAELGRPGPSPTIAAGQLFTRGTFCTDVAYDPEMYFAGEEISIAARAFTAGYDLYYPNENLIWHRYHHDHPKHWEDDDMHVELHSRATERLRRLFQGDPGSCSPYGLGSVRSLAEFEDHAGIDLGAPRGGDVGAIAVDRSVLEPRDDYEVFVFVFLDRTGNEIDRREVRAPDVLGLRRSSVVFEGLSPMATQYLLVPMRRGGRVGEVALRSMPVSRTRSG
ncbi:MAG: GlcNAc-transferase family protein [Ilumatobacteraceae bacterium]